MDQALQLGLRSRTSNCAFNEAIGVGLRSEDSGVFAGVLETLVPAQIWKELAFIVVCHLQNSPISK
jgi:hypothetical protein